jgi:RNA polymerase sigma-70 factor (ECF subfamily)
MGKGGLGADRKMGDEQASNVEPCNAGSAVRDETPALLDRAATGREQEEITAGSNATQLISYALSRDRPREAVAIMARVYGRAVFAYCFRMLHNASEAEDVSQTVFLEALEDICAYRGALARSWLIGIAHHRCLDALAARRVRAQRTESIDGSAEHVDPGPLSDEQVQSRMAVATLGECMEALSPEVRISLLMRFKEGRSFTEIGSSFGEPPKTLEKRVARAVEKLRHCMETKGVKP